MSDDQDMFRTSVSARTRRRLSTALMWAVIGLWSVVTIGHIGAGTAAAAPAPQVITLHPGGNPGQRVDAVVDHGRGTITVLQRFLIQPSQLTAAWVNLRTGAAGSTGLPDRVAPTNPLDYPDRGAVLRTGPGPVALVVYGPFPPQTGLIPTPSYILPIPHLVTV